MLNRDSLQSSIRKHFGLKTDNRRASPAEQGISKMMVDLYKNYQTELTHDQLFNWHLMLTNGRRDLSNIGAYRTHAEPMQIVSGSLYEPKIYYEAPPSDRVPDEMDAFITWFNQTEKGQAKELPSLIRSGVAHIYFESIHPFEDGNGRIGRVISEKALSQSLGRPTLIAIAHTIEKKRKDYYSGLQSGSKDSEIGEWLYYFCEMVLKAQDHTQSMIDLLINKEKFYWKFDKRLNPRQHKVIERIFREGVDGFKGGLSAENYISITGAARATATRDLQRLVEMGAMTKTGERKYTRYYLKDVWIRFYQKSLCSALPSVLGDTPSCAAYCGWVIVDGNKKIYSLSRFGGIRVRDLKAHLGSPRKLPTAEHFFNSIPEFLMLNTRHRV